MSAGAKYMSKFQNRLLSLIMSGLFAVSLLAWSGKAAEYAQSAETVVKKPKLRVVIDAGHGGDDPGKIGVNNVPEKEINLQITEILAKFLRANDLEVILTRESQEGLYDAGAPNKKVQDMKRRVEKIEAVSPMLTVSIHQNSYPQEKVQGPQVFYYRNSVEGQRLAQTIQSMLWELDREHVRQIKENDSYYLLKKTSAPIVIVECGFLSNREEAQKLCDPLYQERVAWKIHLGILQYLNSLSGT